MKNFSKSNGLFVFLLCVLSINLVFAEVVKGGHGLSINGTLKYGSDFERFEYTSENAVKGGALILHDIGSFDKLNPYTLKGIAPLGLESLVFETLAVSSLDEPFSKYSHIAEDVEVASDNLSMTIRIDKNAKFSDGTDIAADDVLFSLNTMKSNKVHPLYGQYYRDIKHGVRIDDYTVKFIFAQPNRELPLIALDIPVFSSVYYSRYEFGKEVADAVPVGSGPYIIENVIPGKTIVYKRNQNYWAKNKNTRKGMYNFDKITVKVFKDQTISVEAFKAGEFDVQLVNVAKQWARDLTGDKFDRGDMVKKIFKHNNNAGMQCFVFNLRKPFFKDVRVREAIAAAFNFEWTNKSLFFNQYTRNNSFFSNSYLAATGLPEGLELQYLDQFRDKLPERVFTHPLKPPQYLVKNDQRKNLRKAKELLQEAGWKVKDGRLRDSTGEVFAFEILLSSPTFSRVMAPFVKNLNRLGFEASYRVVDPALFTERVQAFDYDMIVNVFGQSQSPGNEQRNYWHSKAADVKGSGNVVGIKSPVVDYLVEKIIYATTQEELIAAAKALDRVLWYGFYVIPNWHLSGHRIAYYNKFNYPETLPKYYNYLQFLMTWWQR